MRISSTPVFELFSFMVHNNRFGSYRGYDDLNMKEKKVFIVT